MGEIKDIFVTEYNEAEQCQGGKQLERLWTTEYYT